MDIVAGLANRLPDSDFNTAGRYITLAKIGLYPWFGGHTPGLYSAIANDAEGRLSRHDWLEEIPSRQIGLRFAGAVVEQGLSITSDSMYKAARDAVPSSDDILVMELMTSGTNVLKDRRLSAESAFYRSLFIEGTILLLSLGAITHQYNQGVILRPQFYLYSSKRVGAAIFSVALSTSCGVLGTIFCPAPLLGNVIGSTVGAAVGDFIGQAIGGFCFMVIYKIIRRANFQRLRSRQEGDDDDGRQEDGDDVDNAMVGVP